MINKILLLIAVIGAITFSAGKVTRCNGPVLYEHLDMGGSKEMKAALLRPITYPEEWNCAIKPKAKGNQPMFVAVKKKLTIDEQDVITFVIVSADNDIMFGGTVYPDEDSRPLYGVWYVDKYGNSDLTTTKSDFRDIALEMFRELAH